MRRYQCRVEGSLCWGSPMNAEDSYKAAELFGRDTDPSLESVLIQVFDLDLQVQETIPLSREIRFVPASVSRYRCRIWGTREWETYEGRTASQAAGLFASGMTESCVVVEVRNTGFYLLERVSIAGKWQYVLKSSVPKAEMFGGDRS